MIAVQTTAATYEITLSRWDLRVIIVRAALPMLRRIPIWTWPVFAFVLVKALWGLE